MLLGFQFSNMLQIEVLHADIPGFLYVNCNDALCAEFRACVEEVPHSISFRQERFHIASVTICGKLMSLVCSQRFGVFYTHFRLLDSNGHRVAVWQPSSCDFARPRVEIVFSRRFVPDITPIILAIVAATVVDKNYMDTS
jgi:hypothetical protein